MFSKFTFLLRVAVSLSYCKNTKNLFYIAREGLLGLPYARRGRVCHFFWHKKILFSSKTCTVAVFFASMMGPYDEYRICFFSKTGIFT